MDPEFFFSTVATAPRGGEIALGRANYSYAIAMRKFMQAFAEHGLPATHLGFPVMVHDARARLRARGTAPVHLGFYPPEELRLLKGARNILCFVWEFSVLRGDEMVTEAHAFASQTRMLSKVDAIWTASAYSARVIGRGTDTPVAVVPAPIAVPPGGDRPAERAGRRRANFVALERLSFVPLAIYPRFQREASALLSRMPVPSGDWTRWIAGQGEGAAVFLTVLNPHDARKGLKESIEAFCRVAERHPEAVWIIKTSSPDDDETSINTRLMTHQVAREQELAGQYFCPRIWITNQRLTEAELAALYGLADFYLCTSQAEGQNFPLQEAMAAGVVPVSVDHTAMADYVDAADALVIPSAPAPLPPSAARTYGLAGASWYAVRPVDVYEKLCEAVSLPPARYAALSRAARARVAQGYSGPAVMRRALEALP